MPELVKFEIHLHSPRWGVINTYEVQMDQQHMKIGRPADPNPIVCVWNDDRRPVWSGGYSKLENGNPLEDLLEIDLIFPPTIFIRSLEIAWRSWRIGSLDDEEIQFQIMLLCEWVNIVSASRPSTDFWRRIF